MLTNTKKVILTMVFTLVAMSLPFSGNALAENEDNSTEIPSSFSLKLDLGDNTKEIMENGGGELKELLLKVESLAEDAFPIYVKQAKAEAMADIIFSTFWILLFAIMASICFRVGLKIDRSVEGESEKEKSSRENWAVNYFIISGVAAVIFIWVLYDSGIAHNIVKYNNPEYAAIQKCMEQAKELKR
ncbi:hypothetical protein ACFL08_00490 [Patescibacteria group bacterium]